MNKPLLDHHSAFIDMYDRLNDYQKARYLDGVFSVLVAENEPKSINFDDELLTRLWKMYLNQSSLENQPEENKKNALSKFVSQLIVVNNARKILSKDGVEEFINYWTEEDDLGYFRFQKQDTWSFNVRIKNWASNNYSGKSKYGFRGSEFKSVTF
jgi:hypothetical protein